MIAFFWDWKIARTYIAIGAVGILAQCSVVAWYFLRKFSVAVLGIPSEHAWAFWLPLIIAAFGCFALRAWGLAVRLWRLAD